MLNKLFLSIVFFVVSIFLSGNLYAQAPEIFSDQDREQLQKDLKMNPEDARLTPEEEQMLADSLKKMTYLFQRFQHVLSLKKDILWGDALAAKIEAFEDTTFVYIYPSAGYKDKGVLPALINRFGNSFDETLSPSVQVIWIIVPQQNLQMPFSLEASIDGGGTFSEEIFTPILNRMRPFYQNKIYQNIDEAGPDILTAMEVFLEDFAKVVGTGFAPKYLIEVEDTERVSGYKLNYFLSSDVADSIRTISLINRVTGIEVTEGVKWTNATTSFSGSTYYTINKIGSYLVSGKVGQDSAYIYVNVNSEDVNDYLRFLLSEMLESAIEEIQKSHEKKLQVKDSIRLAQENNLNILIDNLNNESVNLIATGNSNQMTAYTFDPVTTETDKEYINGLSKNEAVSSLSTSYREYDLTGEILEVLHAKTNILIDLGTSKGRADFLTVIQQDIGTMSADFVLSLLHNDKDDFKRFLVQYIDKKLDQMAQLKVQQ